MKMILLETNQQGFLICIRLEKENEINTLQIRGIYDNKEVFATTNKRKMKRSYRETYMINCSD